MDQKDDESLRLLRETLELEKENNRMLKKIRRSGIITTVITIVYWGLLIGVPLYIYYSYVQPYMNEISSSYSQIKQQVDGIKNAESILPEGIQKLLNYLGGEQATSTPKE